MNLLVPAIGDKVDLARLLGQALHAQGGLLYGSDLSPAARALDRVDRRIDLPGFDAPEFWSVFDAVVRAERIDAVLPVRDAELVDWAERAESGRLPVSMLLSSAETLRLCHDKSRLYTFANSTGVDCPDWHPFDLMGRETTLGFPLILKPRCGSGSRGVVRVESAVELAQAQLQPGTPYLAQSCVRGREYSVDCFATPGGRLAACCVRERLVVRAGQSVSGRCVSDPLLIDSSERLAAQLVFRGVVNFQYLRTDDEIWLIDLNPRFPGGIAQTEAAGFPFVSWTLAALSGTEFQ
jgi:carbamoyl-phosphate synthase large subunit